MQEEQANIQREIYATTQQLQPTFPDELLKMQEKRGKTQLQR